MANFTIEVITPFVGDGAEGNANRPQMGDDYAFIRWTDITATPSAQLTPSPNMYTIKAEVTEAVLDAIEGDGVYHVLSSEEIEVAEDAVMAAIEAGDPDLAQSLWEEIVDG